ncbi:hypothetical protein VM1G_11361 [Cytospora mali]|uniref:Uncharacterized protein n=1 Tax=Cytospora mali TaxID=578113 RepID=A0A194VT79_CYTMA|nr:hypothetical protein VM1G_11361 [Valsa mali]
MVPVDFYAAQSSLDDEDPRPCAGREDGEVLLYGLHEGCFVNDRGTRMLHIQIRVPVMTFTAADDELVEDIQDISQYSQSPVDQLVVCFFECDPGPFKNITFSPPSGYMNINIKIPDRGDTPLYITVRRQNR